MITSEYQKIITTYPRLKIYTPTEVDQKFLNNTLGTIDFIFSFSSLEHDGLGRYGDPLNAYADLETIAKLYCILKENGTLFLGIPVGFDEIVYNAHRIYGYKRLSLVLSMGFRLLDIINEAPFKINNYNYYVMQPIFVLQKS